MERHNNSGEVDSQTQDHENDRQGPKTAHGHYGVPQKHLSVAQERERCKEKKRKGETGSVKMNM